MPRAQPAPCQVVWIAATTSSLVSVFFWRQPDLPWNATNNSTLKWDCSPGLQGRVNIVPRLVGLKFSKILFLRSTCWNIFGMRNPNETLRQRSLGWEPVEFQVDQPLLLRLLTAGCTGDLLGLRQEDRSCHAASPTTALFRARGCLSSGGRVSWNKVLFPYFPRSPKSSRCLLPIQPHITLYWMDYYTDEQFPAPMVPSVRAIHPYWYELLWKDIPVDGNVNPRGPWASSFMNSAKPNVLAISWYGLKWFDMMEVSYKIGYRGTQSSILVGLPIVIQFGDPHGNPHIRRESLRF